MSFFVVSFGDGNNKGGAGGGGSSDCGRRVFHARRWRIVANQARSVSRQASIRDRGGCFTGLGHKDKFNNIGPFGLYLGL
ncbi:hypothetical protein V6N13_034317 [Hibiscus sabdariffa]